MEFIFIISLFISRLRIISVNLKTLKHVSTVYLNLKLIPTLKYFNFLYKQQISTDT